MVVKLNGYERRHKDGCHHRDRISQWGILENNSELYVGHFSSNRPAEYLIRNFPHSRFSIHGLLSRYILYILPERDLLIVKSLLKIVVYIQLSRADDLNVLLLNRVPNNHLLGQCRNRNLLGQCRIRNLLGQRRISNLLGHCSHVSAESGILLGQPNQEFVGSKSGICCAPNQICWVSAESGICWVSAESGICWVSAESGICWVSAEYLLGKCRIRFVGSVPNQEFVGSVPNQEFVGSVPNQEFVGSVPNQEFVGSVPNQEYVGSMPNQEFVGSIESGICWISADQEFVGLLVESVPNQEFVGSKTSHVFANIPTFYLIKIQLIGNTQNSQALSITH